MVRDTNNIGRMIGQLMVAERQAMKATAEQMVDDIEKGFDNGTDSLGNPWEPLAPETIERTGPKILYDQGDLEQSFGYNIQQQSEGVRARVGTNYDEDIVTTHERGSPVQGIPARPIMQPAAINAEENLLGSEFTDTFRDYLLTF